MQRVKGQGNQAGVTNGTSNHINEREDINSWSYQQRYNSGGSNVAMPSAQYALPNYYGTPYPYQAYGINEGGTNGWPASANDSLTYINNYNGQVPADAFGVERTFNSFNFSPTSPPSAGFSYFPNGTDYATSAAAWNSATPLTAPIATPVSAKLQNYEEYYRDATVSGYGIEQRLQNLELNPNAANVNVSVNNVSYGDNLKDEFYKNSNSLYEKKATTWASIAKQPAKLVAQSSGGSKKKGPGMPPPPMVPGKQRSIDIGNWESKNGSSSKPVVQAPPPPPVTKSVWSGPIVSENTNVSALPSTLANTSFTSALPVQNSRPIIPYSTPSSPLHITSPPNHPPPPIMQHSPPQLSPQNFQQQMQHPPPPLLQQASPIHQQSSLKSSSIHQQSSSTNQQSSLKSSSIHQQSSSTNQQSSSKSSSIQQHSSSANQQSSLKSSSIHQQSSSTNQQSSSTNQQSSSKSSSIHQPSSSTHQLFSSSIQNLPTSRPVTPPTTNLSHPILEKLKGKNNYNPSVFDLAVKGARFFVIKSYSEDDIHRSIKYEIWCSTEHGNKRLDEAYNERKKSGGMVYLFFSVNGSGHFCGMAEMVSAVDYNSSSSVWAQDKWKGQFHVNWIYVKDVPNSKLKHIRLENNENKPVTMSRDTQEVRYDKGIDVLKIIHAYQHTTSIFDDFVHYEKRQEEEGTKKIASHHSYNNSMQQQNSSVQQRNYYPKDRDGGFSNHIRSGTNRAGGRSPYGNFTNQRNVSDSLHS